MISWKFALLCATTNVAWARVFCVFLALQTHEQHVTTDNFAHILPQSGCVCYFVFFLPNFNPSDSLVSLLLLLLLRTIGCFPTAYWLCLSAFAVLTPKGLLHFYFWCFQLSFDLTCIMLHFLFGFGRWWGCGYLPSWCLTSSVCSLVLKNGIALFYIGIFGVIAGNKSTIWLLAPDLVGYFSCGWWCALEPNEKSLSF